MLPSHETRLERVRYCVSDLQENGIDLLHADDRKVRQVVTENLDYFQLMLGYDSNARQVLKLIKQQKLSSHRLS